MQDLSALWSSHCERASRYLQPSWSRKYECINKMILCVGWPAVEFCGTKCKFAREGLCDLC
jgi:hypothetical protein